MRIGEISRPDRSIVDGFTGLGTSAIANALDDLRITGVMSGLGPVWRGARLLGPALTVKEVTGVRGAYPPSDFRIGAIIDAAAPGDVVAIDNGGAFVSTWGGVASFAAKARGLAGLVVDGGVRDADEIEEHAFPVFSRHVVPTTARNRLRDEAINVPVALGGVAVAPGDIVVGDPTGVVRIPRDSAADVLARARRFAADDERARREIERGLSFTEALRKFEKL
ncbi:MAG: RraA family protein [Alphaproteobacteria bacterium]